MNMPRPMTITGVKMHPEYKKVITVTTIDGQDWHYLQMDDGTLMIGRPIILYDRETKANVAVFAPLDPYGIPQILRVVLP